VALGADRDTSVSVSATRGGSLMHPFRSALKRLVASRRRAGLRELVKYEEIDDMSEEEAKAALKRCMAEMDEDDEDEEEDDRTEAAGRPAVGNPAQRPGFRSGEDRCYVTPPRAPRPAPRRQIYSGFYTPIADAAIARW
jgi:hypothetical protein